MNSSRLWQVCTGTFVCIAFCSASGHAAPQEQAQPDAEKTQWQSVRPTRIEFQSKESATVLKDHSIQFSGTPGWSEPTLYFRFEFPRAVSRVRLEILPDDRNDTRAIGRTGGEAWLFDVKPSVPLADGSIGPVDFDRCWLDGNENDDGLEDCIDYLSDSGWRIPKLDKLQRAHVLYFEFEKAVKFQAGETLMLGIDSGGAEEFDMISRVRISFEKPSSMKGLK